MDLVDLPRVMVIAQEVLLIGLYLVVGGRSWKERKRSQFDFLKAHHQGVVWLAFGVLFQGLAGILYVLYFWGNEPTIRILLWQIGLVGFYIAAYYLLKYEYRAFEDFYQSEALNDFENLPDRGANE